MPGWNELLNEYDAINPNVGGKWLTDKLTEYLNKVSSLNDDCNVVFYASGFLQKNNVDSGKVSITLEDLNGFMGVVKSLDKTRKLMLILHTPGGSGAAADTIVDYLWRMFPNIEVVVPAYAMSAGTMIALSSCKIWMGKQSQLGPIDPQFVLEGKSVSAYALMQEFDSARKEICGDGKNPPKSNAVQLWAPILQTYGPGMIVSAEEATRYSEQIVEKWLSMKMFASMPTLAKDVAQYFNNAEIHLSHGNRINRDDVKNQGIHVGEIESNQDFQDAILSAYHVMTLIFEKTPATKVIANNKDFRWIKM